MFRMVLSIFENLKHANCNQHYSYLFFPSTSFLFSLVAINILRANNAFFAVALKIKINLEKYFVKIYCDNYFVKKNVFLELTSNYRYIVVFPTHE